MRVVAAVAFFAFPFRLVFPNDQLRQWLYPLEEAAMPMLLQCPSCATKLTAPDTAAGKTLRCPKCNTRFVAGEPRASQSFSTRPLLQGPAPTPAPSGMPGMPLWGWFAIGGGGLLVVVLIIVAVVIGTSDNDTSKFTKAPANVEEPAATNPTPKAAPLIPPPEGPKPSPTPEPTPKPLPPMPEPKPPEIAQKAAQQPYDLKGDTLGMTLQAFKAKYRRKIQGDNREAPFCSDHRSDAARASDPNSSLGEESWHPKAKIVHARITFPFEDFRADKHTPTLAGIKPNFHFYAFIDDRLYEIDYVFPHSGFARIEEAMVATYGKPKGVIRKEYQNSFGAKFPGVILHWDNGVSGIVLTERFLDLKSSHLIFIHHELGKVEESRRAQFHKPGL